MSLRPGKLPADLLEELLARLPAAGADVLLGPGTGRDAAVLDLPEGHVLVATSDPVTFAAEDLGWYAAHVNANDIACLGARPAWMLATVLLPEGTADDVPRRIFDQLTAACVELGVTLAGGHTEVTPSVERAIIAGTMLGTAPRGRIITGGDAAPGDILLLARGVAIEGTALLARECAPALQAAGVPPDIVRRAAQMLRDPGISIARIAADVCATLRPTLLHDPTEGGIATALHEIAARTGTTIRIDPGGIDVYPETGLICAAVGLDPLGLLASGALLIAVRPGHLEAAGAALARARAPFRMMGQLEAGEPRVIMGLADSEAPLPPFARDELARYFEEQAEARAGATVRKEQHT
ncbi:MAG: hydrogenase expression protein [Chloroflexi bacterium]|nr:hydrogenase expression protein [Chloroflexota bacterium]